LAGVVLAVFLVARENEQGDFVRSENGNRAKAIDVAKLHKEAFQAVESGDAEARIDVHERHREEKPKNDGDDIKPDRL
jgi:hypothetical protein